MSKGFSFKVFAIFITAILIIMGIFSAMVLNSAKGVYTQEKVGDLDLKASGVYQFVKDTQSVDQFKDILLKIDNTNTAKDYNLKLVYSYEGKNETVFVDVLADKTETAKLKLISANDINGLGVYHKTLSVYNGETLVKSFDIIFNVGTIEIDNTNNIRAPQLEVAEYNADKMIMYVDINNTATLSSINAVEDLNNSKVTVTNVDYTIEELNLNKWAKVTIDYELKGSVLENELYKDGFNVNLNLVYDSQNDTKTIIEDFVRTDSLSDYVVKQNSQFNDLSLIN